MFRRLSPYVLVALLAAPLPAVLLSPTAVAAPLPVMAGRLDTAFAGGYVEANPTPGGDWGESVAVQADGKVLVAGYFDSDLQAAASTAGVMRFRANGSVDTGFGTGGKFLIDQDGLESVEVVLAQPDGKVLVAGTVGQLDGSGRGYVSRLLADGRPDQSFQGGTALLAADTEILNAALRPSGEVVLSGRSGRKLLVSQLRPDGTTDTSFGQGGSVVREFPGYTCSALALQGDGAVVVGCTLHSGPGYHPPYNDSGDAMVLRFTPSGAPDESFGGDGEVRSTLGSASRPRGMLVSDIAIDSAGRIVVAGTAEMAEGYTPPFPTPGDPGPVSDGSIRRNIRSDIALVRYLPDGSPDRSLAGTGSVITAVPSTAPAARAPGMEPGVSGYAQGASVGLGVAVDPAGRILVAGSVEQPDAVASVLRFTTGGLLDPTFGVEGVSSIAIPWSGWGPIATARFTDLALLGDGRIVTTGRRDQKDNGRITGISLLAARFLPGNARTSAWTWGWNGAGQLGDGSTTDRLQPVAASGMTDVVSLSAGAFHTLGLKGDGTVWAWGWNGVGQLGDGTKTDRLSPARVPGLDGVVAVSAGYYHSLALRGDGSIWAWGWNPVGQLGDGTTTDRLSPVRLAAPDGMASISAGGLHSLATRDAGSLWAWGWNGVAQLGDGTTTDRWMPTRVRSLDWIFGVSAGAWSSFAQQGVFAVNGGLNMAGTNTTVPPMIVNVIGWPLATQTVRLSGGGQHGLLLKDDGTVLGTGTNAFGQIGDGTLDNALKPRAVPGLKAMEIAAGGFHSLAVTMNGSVAAWGWNATGQLGTGDTVDRRRPTVVSGLSNATSVSAGLMHSAAVRVG